MSSVAAASKDRITIAIFALGGEGGGVLAEWIQHVAADHGYIVQGTSVPGVAQRTGSTVYYIEMARRTPDGANLADPVLAMMPVPGDVDVVIASELMEAGRAILRGFVSEDRTVLIGSTHRVYAIAEKAALGDGTGASARILDAAEERSKRFIGLDMAAAAATSGSVISSVMLGALAASEALPFPREAFEEAIRRGGRAVDSNLGGFAIGFERAKDGDPATDEPSGPPTPTTAAGRALLARIEAELPTAARPIAIEGVKRLMDYQDHRYAELYLSRLTPIAALDSSDWRLTSEAARHLALWMAYEDTIRVADLKIRGSRISQVGKEVRLAPGQVMTVTEYMHPRLHEVCDTMPASLGAYVLASPRLSGWMERLFAKGRHVETTSVGWFLTLSCLASLRRIRRSTLRYREEQTRIEDWLAFVSDTATFNKDAAIELLICQQLIKGYSDTFERGLANFQTIMREAQSIVKQPDAAARIRALREAALADDSGKALGCAVAA